MIKSISYQILTHKKKSINHKFILDKAYRGEYNISIMAMTKRSTAKKRFQRVHGGERCISAVAGITLPSIELKSGNA